ncbi:lysine-specific demethylase 2B-like [Babylonia areolata]|uniref:lysine-specific demethylase 2B-like n=1 Tax=Babylonia areolata TaxID=304850 RepID=UPI003FD19D05
MAETADGGRKLRTKERKHYTDMDIDEDDIDGKRNYSIEDKLLRNNFTGNFVQEMKGHDFNMKFIQENGLEAPIVFYDKTGLGMRVPSENFKVTDVKQCVGSRRMLDVMDVNTQKGMEMTMKDWVRYYQNPERDRLLNVISLEFSHTRLDNYVESPTLIRQVDWVDRVWPRHLKECQTESTNIIDKMKYPKVQKYCLMSVAGCYTDFHIDFGGTSVWYHILHGEKVFWLIPPTKDNVERYVNWILSAKQGDYFLADHMDQCQMIRLHAGYTFIIPSGWIHAVYTPKDSLVFGGNFLHSFNISNQLMVANVEDRTHVPQKFRFPFFNEILWYVLDRYLWHLTGKTYLQKPDIKDDPDDRPDSPGALHVDSDSRPPSRNPDSRPPSRSLEDPNPADTKPKVEGEDTPKLSKSITIELTRIDAGLKSSFSEGEYSKRLLKKCASDSSLLDREESAGEEKEVKGEEGGRRRMVLTRWEVDGLVQLVKWVEGMCTMPAGKKGIPKDILDPEGLLHDFKEALKEHEGDSQLLACSGEPLLGWPDSAKKHKQRLKGFGSSSGSAKTKAPKGSGGSSSTIRRRRTRCKKCEPCTRSECGECTFCKDMRKFGGPGRMKQTCISRQCMAPILPHMAVCMHCGLARRSDDPEPEDDNPTATLMECGICWEICHPACLRDTFEAVEMDGVINEDLPSSWECIKCVNVGKQGQLKPRVLKGPKMERRTSQTSDHSIPSPSPQDTPSSTPATTTTPHLTPKVEKTEEGGEGQASPPEGKRVTAKEQHKASVKDRSLSGPKREGKLLKKAIKRSFEHSKASQGSSTSASSSQHASAGRKQQEADPEGDTSPSVKRPRREGCSREREHDPELSGRRSRGQSPSVKKLRPRREKAAEEEGGNSARASPTPGPSRWDSRRHHDDQKPGSSRQSSGGQTGVTSQGGGAGSRGGTPDKAGVTFQGVGGTGSKGRGQEEGSSSGVEKDSGVMRHAFVVRPLALPPPPEQVMTTSGKPHCLERGLWMKVFRYLPPADLSRCLQVCKTWNRWAIHPSLWTWVSLARTHLKQAHLMGVVLRQPRSLNLASAHLSHKQLAWLVPRLPHLRSLTLASQPWATVCALCSPSTPLLRSLVLSWATGIRPDRFQELIEPPLGVRPGLTPSLSRLHQLRHLDLSGTEVGDSSLGLVSAHLGLLETLDLRACMKLTDAGLQALVTQGRPLLMSLLSLNLCRCWGLTDRCLTSLMALQRMRHLDVSRIPTISRPALYHFSQHYSWRPLQMASLAVFTVAE